jgi:hypothetical protein
VAPIEPEQGHSTLGGRRKKKTGIFAVSLSSSFKVEEKKSVFSKQHNFFSFNKKPDVSKL